MMNLHVAYSAVKIDVSDVSASCDSKVLVLSHESSTRDVIVSLLKKLKMRDADSSRFVVEAEILADQDLAILQFEDEDKLMQAYHQFPKGSMRLCMRYKPEFDMDIADHKRGKVGVNGHQLTLQRIRRSLEKLKRKSSNPSNAQSNAASTSKSTGSSSKDVVEGLTTPRSARTDKLRSTSLNDVPTTPRSARPPIKPSSPTRIKSQGVSAGTSTSTSSATAHASSSRGQRSPVTSSLDKTAVSNGATDRRREYRSNRTERNRRRSYAGDENGGYKSPFSLNKQMSTYKTTTLPHGASGAASDTECMIFYDSAADMGLTGAGAGASSLSHLPTTSSSHHAPVTSRSHVMPRHVDVASNQHAGAKQTMSIDKPAKLAYNRNLEDSGIDVKSPPVLSAGRTRDRVNSMGDPDAYNKHTPTKPPMVNGHSQESYVSPAFSESSPFSFVSVGEANHVKRTGSFSSLKSLPVTVYKEPGEGSPFMFEPINQDRLRSKSQSMTNLHNNKVVRRRSLPPLDVSQEKLEAKKSSLSKRLAKKISNFRNNEKRYMLPSPHNFTAQNLQQYKSSPERHRPGDNRGRMGDNSGRSQDKVMDNDDNVSEADMEVANILEGKPAHPTDSDVEDYLACVESTNTTQSDSRHGDLDTHTESTPYDHLEKTHKPHSHGKSSSKHDPVDITSPRGSKPESAFYSQPNEKHRTHSFSKPTDNTYTDYNSNRKHVTENSNYSHKTSSKYEPKDRSHHESKDKPRDVSKSMDSGIESAYSKSQHSSASIDKTKVITPQKPKKALNKFVEQSMKSFLSDCHPGAMSDSDILDMHHAALQGTIPSPYRDKPEIAAKPDISQFGPSHKGSMNVEPKSQASKVDKSFDASQISGTQKQTASSTPDAVTEYEKARARFAQLATSHTTNNDVTNQQTPKSADSTYKSKMQLTLQPAAKTPPRDGLEPATDRQLEPAPVRRHSHPAAMNVNHVSKDKTYIQDQPEEDTSGKPLTLFAIIRTHSVVAVHLEKGGSKSFGIVVKRVLLTSTGRVREGAGNQNVVVVQEVTSHAPPGAATNVFPHDVIIEVNGHNVLQSSDKVVRTLLDARSALEMVIARSKTSKLPGSSADMETTRGYTSKLPETINLMSDTNSSHSRSPPLVFHNMDDIQPELTLKPEDQGQIPTGSLSARSRVYAERTRSFDGGSRSYEQGAEVTNWNAKSSQYDAVLNSPRFNQLSEGPTFVL